MIDEETKAQRSLVTYPKCAEVGFKPRFILQASVHLSTIFDPIVNHFSQLIAIVMVLMSSVMVIFFGLRGIISL